MKEPGESARRGAARTLVMVTALGAAVTVAVGGLPGDQLLAFGRGLAMLSAGIMRPEGGAQTLSERLDRQPAAQGGSGGREPVAGPTQPYLPGAGNATDQTPDDQTAGAEPAVVPPEAGDGGKILEQKIAGGSLVQGVSIKNASSVTLNIAEQLGIAPNLGITATDEPQVLIVHTHTTEAYMTYDAGYYNASDKSRTQDESINVCAVGEAIASQLRAAGIGVIHDTTVHDSPQYTGAYNRSAETVEKQLAEHPSIKVVLDIHRDAINRSNTEKVKPTVEVNGRKAAQMMILASAGNTASQPNPHWQENVRFALRLHSGLNTQYDGIMRPLYLVDSRYNQHLTNGSLIVEIGAEGNTVEEAEYSGQLLGKTLAQVLNDLKR